MEEQTESKSWLEMDIDQFNLDDFTIDCGC